MLKRTLLLQVPLPEPKQSVDCGGDACHLSDAELFDSMFGESAGRGLVVLGDLWADVPRLAYYIYM